MKDIHRYWLGLFLGVTVTTLEVSLGVFAIVIIAGAILANILES